MPTKKRSATYIKDKWKQYYQYKKSTLKEKWENLTIEAIKRRLRERCAKTDALHIAEMEEEKKKEKLPIAKLCEV